MNNSTFPKVSIITVSFNSGKTIKETIESVINQAYPNIEYIIVDGNSTDNTKEIIANYKSQISKYISEKDSGIYDAMNKGLAMCTGDIIGILNSDDIYLNSNVISDVVELFINTKANIVSTSISIFKDKPENIIRKYSATIWRKWMFRIAWQPPHPGFFVKKEVYQQVGNFDTKFRIAADFDFMLRCILIHKINVIKSSLVSVNMRAGGESQKSIKNIIKTNKEDHLSLKKNGFFSLEILMYLKYPLKMFQFVFK